MRLIARMRTGEEKLMWDSDVSVICGVGIASVLPSRCELSLRVCCADPRCGDTRQVGAIPASVLVE